MLTLPVILNESGVEPEVDLTLIIASGYGSLQ